MASDLGAADLRTILEIVRQVSTAATLTDFRRMVPELVLTAVPGNLAAYNEIDVRTGASYAIYSPVDAVPEETVDRFGDYSLEHPTLQLMARTGNGSAVTISDVVTREQFRASRLYGELFASIAAEDQIAIGLPAPRPLIIGIPINRDSWGFSPRERGILDELRPHLAQAHANAATRDWLREGLDARDLALSTAGTGVIRVENEVVADASPVAMRWLRRGLLDGDRLGGDLREWYRNERARLDGAPDAPPEVAMPLRLTDHEAAMTLRFVDETTLLVQQVPAPASADLVRFGLTPGQARVLELVIAGASTPQIAAALHITAATVRKHLEAVFAKLGVHSRAAAVAMALSR